MMHSISNRVAGKITIVRLHGPWYYSMTCCSLVHKHYKGADVTINRVNWPQHMDKFTIEEVDKSHHMVIITEPCVHAISTHNSKRFCNWIGYK